MPTLVGKKHAQLLLPNTNSSNATIKPNEHGQITASKYHHIVAVLIAYQDIEGRLLKCAR